MELFWREMVDMDYRMALFYSCLTPDTGIPNILLQFDPYGGRCDQKVPGANPEHIHALDHHTLSACYFPPKVLK